MRHTAEKKDRIPGDAWQDVLKKAFEAPAPMHREEFMQKVAPLKPCSGNFFLIQFLYIRKRIWVVSAFLFTAALYASLVLSVDTLWDISALTPLLALLMVAETGRSERFEMAELEMATRFSLKSVLLTRLVILGFGNLLLLAVLFPVSLFCSEIPPLQAGLYIVTPFLLATLSCLHIVRRHRGQEGIYLCMGVSACIGLLVYGSRLSLPRLYEESSLIYWLVVSTLSLFCIIRQYRGIILLEELP